MSGWRRSSLALAVVAVCVIASCDGRKPGRDAVIQARTNDPRLTAATAEATRRWSEFTDAFAHRRPKWAYAVKVALPVKGADKAEHLWIGVLAIDGDTIHGSIDNKPVADVGYQYGDPVTVPVSEVEDWLFASDPDHVTGGFTVRVLEQIQREEEASR